MKVIAVDLGASSGRLISVSLKNGKVELEELHRFLNEGIYAGDRFYTDILNIFHEILKGLQIAQKKIGKIDAIGIDTWGVDFAFLDSQGELLGNPYHYRDTQAIGMMEKAGNIFGKKGLFYETGVQDMWYNTVYQILGIQNRNSEKAAGKKTFLMLPDVLGYFLTGERSLEYTSVSTTQMYDLKNKSWAESVLYELGLEKSVFPEVLMTGAVKGNLTKRIKKLAGIGEAGDIPLIAVAQHDSASAAYAVPAQEDNYVFINSGTWSIIGMVMDEPVVTGMVYDRNFSNEGAAFGKIKLVKTIMGMWLIQELRKCWEKKGSNIDYTYLIKEAEAASPFSHFIEVDDELFVAPLDMEDAVNQYCVRTKQNEIQTQGGFYRAVMESLAFKYKESVCDVEEITGKKTDTLYLLGGAVRDAMFCQFIANATGKTVSAGPVEATAVGNAMIQMKALGKIQNEKENAGIIQSSFDIIKYKPQDLELWDKMYQKYKIITERK